ncbi:MAG: hypothetical protein A2091_10435 [Desulfuromonadales bacterium GWD2_61_12]|nr:MAG: hypothetical protein A2005_09250 [Desulfuromonadales bacterium GWC2_61_20]OGR36278.1 MAG: hypothetical protein A2091_10435 [Desulfuromonadales bacterium GWD2_61_12]HAD03679.1 DUF4212 domain-containing protein [Desulfuromonas sp.]HBT84223.1 DUF4212 domain-containing protein [Desulfuromonas sp.]
MPPPHPPQDIKPPHGINFFRPRPGYMRSKVTYIWLALGGWILVTFGFQFLLLASQKSSAGTSMLTEASLFGFPFHFWFTGQFLIVWFILLCIIFNLLVDRLSDRTRKRR